MKAWFLSWFGREPIDAAPSSPALYVAGPLAIERAGVAGYRVAQQCGLDLRGAPLERAWSFANAAEMKKQLDEFGGAATAPELAAVLAPIGEIDLTPVPADPVATLAPVQLASPWEP